MSSSASTPQVSPSPSSSSPAPTPSQNPPTSTSTSTSAPPPSQTSASGGSSTSSSSSTSVRSSSSSTSTQTPSSTSSSTPSTTPPSRTTLTPSDTPSTFLSVSNGNTIVVTTVIRSTPTSTGNVNTNTSTKGFFQNTGAVAGTFTVVGLVGLAILIFIITTVVRRRRADKFDKDAALAAAEAAATAHSPDFDDGYGFAANHHGTGGGYGYADTYQAPVQFPPTREAYGMSNIGANAYVDPDNYSVGTGGPGTAGIGAGGLYRSKSGKDQQDPFIAYAAHHDPTIQQQQANMRHRNLGQNRWDDPNLGGGGYDVARAQPYPETSGIVRSKSVQSSNPAQSLASHYSTEPLTQDPYAQPPPVPESYSNHYRAGPGPEKHQPQTRPLSTASMTDVYGGVITEKRPPVPEKPGNAGGLPNPFEGHSSGDRNSGSSDYSEGGNPVFAHDDLRMSVRDDEDYGAGRRVLKVANE